jgi:LacI family transcriptional regulator
MANAAIDILLRTIRRSSGDTPVLRDHVVPHRLIVRDSVAAPPKRR